MASSADATATPNIDDGDVDTTFRRRPPEITRFSGAIGVISRPDLHETLDAENAARVRRALAAHHVIFFRDQPLSDSEQWALASQFGDLAVFPIHKLIGSARPFLGALTDHFAQTRTLRRYVVA